MLTIQKLLHFITGNRGKNKTQKQAQNGPCGFQVYFLKVCVH